MKAWTGTIRDAHFCFVDFSLDFLIYIYTIRDLVILILLLNEIHWGWHAVKRTIFLIWVLNRIPYGFSPAQNPA
jgi:hypothetical protein